MRKIKRFSLQGVSLAFMLMLTAHAEDWRPFTGADTLQDFVFGAIVEITLTPGVTAVGKYHADGPAAIPDPEGGPHAVPGIRFRFRDFRGSLAGGHTVRLQPHDLRPR